MAACVNQLQQARNSLNHKGEIPLSIAQVRSVNDSAIAIYTSLGLDTNRLVGLERHLSEFDGKVTVQGVVEGGLRIPFADARKFLVGRTALVEDIAGAVREAPWRRDLIYGTSGDIPFIFRVRSPRPNTSC